MGRSGQLPPVACLHPFDQDVLHQVLAVEDFVDQLLVLDVVVTLQLEAPARLWEDRLG